MAEAGAAASKAGTSCAADLGSPAPSDVLKDVVAYVEVRTASDNRSLAVTRVLERMGARVEGKFSNDVTHVIFKEGKKRTRDKALKLGVHLVSVLWVDSCKELQHKVDEKHFAANTERCGTPPPGVRWKKYKSMQPRDFDVEVVRSGERCQKRRRRMDNHKLLLQGGGSTPPSFSPSHVLVVDTQPRSPFAMAALGLDFYSPVIIPNTPPSMQARLDQLKRQREARRLGEIEESPLTRNTVEELPLQRTLFTSQTSSAEEERSTEPTAERKSTQLSVGVDTDAAADAPSVSHGSAEQQNHATHPKPTETVLPSQSGLPSRKQARPRSNPETSLLNTSLKGVVVPSKKSTVNNRRSLNIRLPREAAEQSFSQGNLASVQSRHKMTTRRSLAGGVGIELNSVPAVSSHQQSAVGLESKGSKKDSEEKKRSGENGRICHESSVSSNTKPDKKQNHLLPRRNSKRASAVFDVDNPKAACSASESNSSRNITSKPLCTQTVTKRRKLLNPSQEVHILSPFPAVNQSALRRTSAEVKTQVLGKERKSCDVGDIFPITLPATAKRGHRTSKENRKARKRGSSSPASSNSCDDESPGETRTQKSRNSRKVSQQRRAKDMSASASALCSTSHTGSILGSSLSMIYSDTSTTESCQRRFAPPRNSIAEFQVSKAGQRRRPSSREGSGRSAEEDVEKASKPMSLHKFGVSCMPSLVMTSLHRAEQEVVIAAVKKLGVFRLEERVSKDTTHVVYGERRRTLNVLHGLARGCWLVSQQWVLHSLEERQWLCEDAYESTEDYPSAMEARLAREAEAPRVYSCSIFETAGSLFVSNTCTPPRSQMLKLLHLCGAKVTDSIQRADFYIGDQSHEEKNSVNPIWVLDCISQQKLLPMENYILAINFKAKASSSPEY